MKYKLMYLLALTIIIVGCSNQEKSKETDAKSIDTLSTKNTLQDLLDEAELKPNDPVVLHNVARWYIDNKRYKDAYESMGRVIQLDPSKPEYHLSMADLSFAANRTYDTKGHLEKALELDPENIEAMMRLAELNLIVKQHAESVELLNRVLEKDKTNTTAWFMRGINFKENRDTNRAISDFQSAIEADANYYNSYMQLGMIFHLRNDPAAEGYFNNAIRVRPNSEEAIYGRGMWFQESNQLDKAIQDYTTITQINPSNKNAHFNLGYIHHVYLNLFSEAINHYNRAIQADFQYAEAFYNRALCYEALGNLDAAQSDYSAAIKIRGKYPVAEEGLKRVSK